MRKCLNLPSRDRRRHTFHYTYLLLSALILYVNIVRLVMPNLSVVSALRQPQPLSLTQAADPTAVSATPQPQAVAQQPRATEHEAQSIQVVSSASTP